MGYYVFANGVILDEAELNLLMRQTTAVFYSTAERDASLTEGPTEGQLVHVVGLGVQQYLGGAWRMLVPDVPYSRYHSPPGQTFATGTWQRVNLNQLDLNSGAWTHSTVSSGSMFTCVIPGRYALGAFLRFGSAAASHRALAIADGSAQNVNVSAFTGVNTGATDYWGATILGERDFAVDDTFSVWGYQSSGGTISPATDFGAPWVNMREVLAGA